MVMVKVTSCSYLSAYAVIVPVVLGIERVRWQLKTTGHRLPLIFMPSILSLSRQVHQVWRRWLTTTGRSQILRKSKLEVGLRFQTLLGISNALFCKYTSQSLLLFPSSFSAALPARYEAALSYGLPLCSCCCSSCCCLA